MLSFIERIKNKIYCRSYKQVFVSSHSKKSHGNPTGLLYLEYHGKVFFKTKKDMNIYV